VRGDQDDDRPEERDGLEESDSGDSRDLIPFITIAQMNRDVRSYIATTDIDYVWTDDWSPEFYRAQAKLGFIAISQPGPADFGNVLLPELQHAYAVLDWPDLSIDRGVRRILESNRIERESIRLRVDSNPEPVLGLLADHWGQRSWLLPEYRQLMNTLAAERARSAEEGFRILGAVLSWGGEPVAGELGYAVGRAYVSLSGFLRRGRREWNHFGKLQMVLLADWLEEAGFSFWNLGHPHLKYKTRLGARILARPEFLSLWDTAAAAGLPPGLP